MTRLVSRVKQSHEMLCLVSSKTMGSFTSFKPGKFRFFSELLKASRNQKRNDTSVSVLLNIHERKGGGAPTLPSTIPFTSSSVLFIPHGGLPRFTAGLLTLGNSRQPSTARRPMWFRTLKKTPHGSAHSCAVSQRCQIATNILENRFFRAGKMIFGY